MLNNDDLVNKDRIFFYTMKYLMPHALWKNRNFSFFHSCHFILFLLFFLLESNQNQRFFLKILQR